jgi:hypothetical protein
MENLNELLAKMQENADVLCAEISKLLSSNTAITEEKVNELIQLGLEISMMCSDLSEEL